jgi:hypothetical protein
MWHAWERGERSRGFCGGNLTERHKPEDRGVDGRTGLEWISGRLAGGGGWIQLAQDRGRWRAVVNAVMNLGVLEPRSWLGPCLPISKLLFGHTNYYKFLGSRMTQCFQ